MKRWSNEKHGKSHYRRKKIIGEYILSAIPKMNCAWQKYVPKKAIVHSNICWHWKSFNWILVLCDALNSFAFALFFHIITNHVMTCIIYLLCLWVCVNLNQKLWHFHIQIIWNAISLSNKKLKEYFGVHFVACSILPKFIRQANTNNVLWHSTL